MGAVLAGTFEAKTITMSKVWYLNIHRWLTLVFALPLAIVLTTGLILSVEPSIVIGAIKPGSVAAGDLEAIIKRHDPDGRTQFIAQQSYDKTVTIRGPAGTKVIDIASGEQVQSSATATFFSASRRLHEALMLNASWLVTGSTIAMLIVVAFGVLMGLPRLRNSVSGWHKGTGWFLLPLVVLSPLTGLAISFGVTFSAPPVITGSPSPSNLIEAVQIVGANHDLSSLVWIRPRGKQVLARLVEDGEYRVYAVTQSGTMPTPRNWPRLIHEGNWYGHVSAALNVVISFALIGLMGTGLFMWARRKLRTRPSRSPLRDAASTARAGS